MAHAVTAQGNIQKLVMAAMFVGAVIGVGTWYPQFGQSYEVKNAAKLACNDVIKQFRFKVTGQDEAWREPFVRRATQAGVRLAPKQYSFVPSQDRQAGEFVCKAKITYPTKSEWAFIGPIFALDTIAGTKVISFEHRVRDSF